MPVERTLNGKFDGVQYVAGPAAAATLPGGGAVVVYASEVKNAGAPSGYELRLARVGPDGVPLGTSCWTADAKDDALVAVAAGGGTQLDLVSVATHAQVGHVSLAVFGQLVTWPDGTPSYPPWAQVIDERGCGPSPTASSPLQLGLDLVTDEISGPPVAAPLGTGIGGDDFAIFWFDKLPSQADSLKGRVLRHAPTGAVFLATDADQAGGPVDLYRDAEIAVDLAAVAVAPDRVAVFWSEIYEKASPTRPDGTDLFARVRLAFFDERLHMLAGPLDVATGPADLEKMPYGRKITAGFDGSHLLVVWLQPDGSTQYRAWARVFDSYGNPAPRPDAKDGTAFRMGAAEGASDSLPSVFGLSSGGFLAAWRQIATGGANDSGDVRAIALYSDGTPRFNGRSCDSTDFPLVAANEGDQRISTFALLGGGDVLAAWTDKGPNGPDPAGSVRSAMIRAGDLLADNSHDQPAPGASTTGHSPDAADGCLGLKGSARAGMRCSCNSDCAGNLPCITEASSRVPGGACWQECVAGDATTCESGESCVAASATHNTSICQPTCQVAADCPPGRVCFRGSCYLLCALDSDCQSGHCDTYQGICTDGTPRPGAGIDAPCLRNDDCRSGVCSTITHTCATSCQVSRPNCPENASCVVLTPTDDVGMCMGSPSFICNFVGTYCNKLNACAPAVAATMFGDSATCVARFQQACQKELSAPSTGDSASAESLCQTAYGTGTCHDAIYGVSPACHIAGARANGAACAYSSQCASAYCFTAEDRMCGVCANRVPAGGDCSTGVSCESGLTCNSDGLCVVPGTTGAACDTSQPCELGSYCRSGICTAQGATAGAPCDDSHGCDLLKSLTCATKLGQCVQVHYAAATQECGVINNQVVVCAATMSCDIPSGQSTGTCPDFVKDGEPCGTTSTDPACLAPARCVAGRCALPDPVRCN